MNKILDWLRWLWEGLMLWRKQKEASHEQAHQEAEKIDQEAHDEKTRIDSMDESAVDDELERLRHSAGNIKPR